MPDHPAGQEAARSVNSAVIFMVPILYDKWLVRTFDSISSLLTVAAKRRGRADFLDLDMNLQRVGTRITFQPYRKPGNAYIPFT